MFQRPIHFVGTTTVCSCTKTKPVERTLHTTSSYQKFTIPGLSFIKYFQKHKESLTETPKPPEEPVKVETQNKAGGPYAVIGGGRRNNLVPLKLSPWMNPNPITAEQDILKTVESVVRQYNPKVTDWQNMPLEDYRMKFKIIVQASEKIGRRVPDRDMTRIKNVNSLIKFYITPEKKKTKYLVIDQSMLEGTNIRMKEHKYKEKI